MIVSREVDLVDRTVLLAPIRKLDEAVLFRDIRYRAKNGITWSRVLALHVNAAERR